MKKSIELSSLQMKDVKGGGHPHMSMFKEDTAGGSGSGSGHCFVDGETIFECMCSSDEQCQNVYGPSAKCWV